ncbi:MAG: ArnT family glycosyltransferase [Caldimicrobium sp.]
MRKLPRSLLILFLILLIFGIFYNLGERPLFGVEGRWAEASREMILRGSWFVPTLNFEPHVTKPLIPFWLIKISEQLLGISELSARLPGAILGLLSCLLFYFISKRLFKDDLAILGTLLYGVSLGFLQFSRLAQSEIYQLFGLVSAIAVYLYFRDKTNLVGYLLFILAMLFGALSKGITSIAVLTIFVLVDIFLYRRFYHFNLKLFISLVIGIFLYFLPYYLTSKELNTELPFHLWFIENIKQAFDPYDNLRPFYIYLYAWPMWVLPFSLFLIDSLYKNFKNFKNFLNFSPSEEKLFFITNLLIFLLFTLAKARRDYYILPILPFSIILITFYLQNIKEVLIKLYTYLSYLLPLLSIISIIFLKKFGYSLNLELIFWLIVTIILQIFIIAKFIIPKASGDRLVKIMALGLIFYLSEIYFFSVIQPIYSFSTEKEAGIFVKNLLTKNPNLKLCSFSPQEKPTANFYYYARIKSKVEDFRELKKDLFECNIIVIRKTIDIEWINSFQTKGFQLVKFESKKDKSKSYYVLYNSSTLKTPSF